MMGHYDVVLPLLRRASKIMGIAVVAFFAVMLCWCAVLVLVKLAFPQEVRAIFLLGRVWYGMGAFGFGAGALSLVFLIAHEIAWQVFIVEVTSVKSVRGRCFVHGAVVYKSVSTWDEFLEKGFNSASHLFIELHSDRGAPGNFTGARLIFLGSMGLAYSYEARLTPEQDERALQYVREIKDRSIWPSCRLSPFLFRLGVPGRAFVSIPGNAHG